VLIVDLTNDELDGATVVRALSQEGELAQMRTLGFYSHVDVRARERAEEAGFDLVVPRSRMSREAPELLASMAFDP
jgi:CheY-like chemotaxis protein